MAGLDVVGVALGDLEAELADTRKLLERLPDEHWGWAPHAKSWPLGKLGAHIANLLLWVEMSIAGEGYDLGADSPAGAEPANTAELLALYDGHAARVREVAAEATAESLAKNWTLRHGDTVFFTMARAAVTRRYAISHLVHHRGQLSVYLRQLDVPLPAIYGPTADEGIA